MASESGHTFSFDENDAAVVSDDFLIREGLDLLAAFRAIKNDEVRANLLQIIMTLAGADGYKRL